MSPSRSIPSVRVLAIPGSLRAASVNRLLLRAAREEAPVGAEVVVWDRLADLPAFDGDLEADLPASVRELKDAIASADAVLIATPEYNSSIPGALKNALDWASRPHGLSPLIGKPALVIGASPSPFGAAWAQQETRKVLRATGATVLESGLALGKAPERFDESGKLADDVARAELGGLLEELVALALAPPVARAA